MITGGIDCSFPVYGYSRPSYDLTEVIDLTTRKSHIAGNLNHPRQNHGMLVMKIDNALKLVVFGSRLELPDLILVESDLKFVPLGWIPDELGSIPFMISSLYSSDKL